MTNARDLKLLLVLVSTIAGIMLMTATTAAQDVPSPPKPESGPSLEVTMKFIHDQLANRGVVSYSYKDLDPEEDDIYYVNRILEVQTDPATCSLSFHADQTSEYTTYSKRTGNSRTHADDTSETFHFSFRDITKLEVRDSDHPVVPDHTGYTTVPTVYYLSLTATKAAVDYDMQCTGECAGPQSQHMKVAYAGLMFYFEDPANRVAKAMLHAVELCGGGQKEQEAF